MGYFVVQCPRVLGNLAFSKSFAQVYYADLSSDRRFAVLFTLIGAGYLLRLQKFTNRDS